jgi:drug/metabolite transporter (DMT)-like permease
LVWSLLTVLAWGVWGVLSKALAGLTAEQQQAFSTVGMLPIMAILLVTPGWKVGERRVRGAGVALAAGLLSCLGTIALYRALAAGEQASTAVTLTALYPLVAVVLAYLFLREKPAWWQWVGVVGSLVAIYLLTIGKDFATVPRELVFAVAPILLWGASAVVTKLAVRDVSAEAAAFWFLATCVPLSAVLVAVEPMRWELSSREWLAVAALGATYGLGNLTLLAAFRAGGKAAVVTPLCGMYPVATIPLAILFFDEKIDPAAWVGIGLALVSAAVLAYEKTPGPTTTGGTTDAEAYHPTAP